MSSDASHSHLEIRRVNYRFTTAWLDADLLVINRRKLGLLKFDG